MKVINIFLTLFFLSWTSLSFAQSFWEKLPGANGTYNVSTLAKDTTNGNIYAGTPNGGGIFVSTDNGMNWMPKSNGLPVNESVTDIQIGPSGAIFAMVNGIYKSTDGGETWNLLPNAPNGMTNMHITAEGHIFAGQSTTTAGNGIYRSTDGGENWEQKSEGLPTVVIFFTYYRSVTAITSDASGNLYASVSGGDASTEAGIYKSTDNGDNWVRSSEGLLEDYTVGPVIASANGFIYAGVKNEVYKSGDGAVSWSVIGGGPFSESALIKKMSVNAAGDVFVSSTDGTYKAAAEGTDWTALNAYYTNDFLMLANGDYLTATLDIWGISGGIYRSTDGGATWESSNHGINNTLTTAFYISESGVIYNGLYRGRIDYSMDDGASFTRITLPYSDATFAGVNAIIENPQGNLCVATGEGIFTSSDGGENWTKSFQTGIRCLTVDLDGNMIVGGEYGAYRSEDNGQSWQSLDGGGNVYNIFVTNSGAILAGTYNGGINRSGDNGGSWTNSGTELFGNITVGKFTQTSDGTIYVHTLLGLYKSSDDGVSWEAANVAGINQQFRTLISTGNTLLLGTPNGLYKSEDGTATWTNHVDGLSWTFLDHLAISPDSYIHGSGGSGIYKSSQPLVTSLERNEHSIVSGFRLEQNYPNPFNPTTTIRWHSPKGSRHTLKIYDALGNEAATLVDAYKAAGRHEVQWNADSYSSGIYFYQLKAGDFIETKRLLLLK